MRLFICRVAVLCPLFLEMVKGPCTTGAYIVVLPPLSILATHSSAFPGACRTQFMPKLLKVYPEPLQTRVRDPHRTLSFLPRAAGDRDVG